MEPSDREPVDISLKDGNKCLNRFCIDEDAGFELSEVRFLEKASLHNLFNSGLYLKGKGKLR